MNAYRNSLAHVWDPHSQPAEADVGAPVRIVQSQLVHAIFGYQQLQLLVRQNHGNSTHGVLRAWDFYVIWFGSRSHHPDPFTNAKEISQTIGRVAAARADRSKFASCLVILTPAVLQSGRGQDLYQSGRKCAFCEKLKQVKRQIQHVECGDQQADTKGA